MPRGLRARLALSISLITAVVVGGSFFAVHQGTGSELQRKIDQDLNEQFVEFQQQALAGIDTTKQLERAAKKWVASQRYHPESRIFVIQVNGRPDVTNQQDVVERELEAENGTGEAASETEGTTRLLNAPSGMTNASSEEAGRLRVLSRPIVQDGQTLGTFRVADPRQPIERAQAGLRKTYLAVSLVALLVSIAVAVSVANLITRPLRRMAGVASAVDAGELTHRIGDVGTGYEATMLAESFDHMLDRLESAFTRQHEFVSDASHELRTPLTVLRGQLELLAREDDSAEERVRTIEMLLRGLDHMSRLVDDMLVLARAEAGELIQPQPIVLADYLEDLQRDLPLFGERDFHVEGPRHGTLVADPDRLSQVLRNLVKNAVSHTEHGDRVTVALKPRGDRLEFSVADGGPGIPQEQLERVFDRFYRTDTGRARDEGGSGLGLAIARAIVKAHGGRIWAESPAGGGASINFEVPGYRPARAPPQYARPTRS
jgi:two-component system OmpR family sensor kinase